RSRSRLPSRAGAAATSRSSPILPLANQRREFVRARRVRPLRTGPDPIASRAHPLGHDAEEERETPEAEGGQPRHRRALTRAHGSVPDGESAPAPPARAAQRDAGRSTPPPPRGPTSRAPTSRAISGPRPTP